MLLNSWRLFWTGRKRRVYSISLVVAWVLCVFTLLQPGIDVGDRNALSRGPGFMALWLANLAGIVGTIAALSGMRRVRESLLHRTPPDTYHVVPYLLLVSGAIVAAQVVQGLVMVLRLVPVLQHLEVPVLPTAPVVIVEMLCYLVAASLALSGSMFLVAAWAKGVLGYVIGFYGLCFGFVLGTFVAAALGVAFGFVDMDIVLPTATTAHEAMREAPRVMIPVFIAGMVITAAAVWGLLLWRLRVHLSSFPQNSS